MVVDEGEVVGGDEGVGGVVVVIDEGVDVGEGVVGGVVVVIDEGVGVGVGEVVVGGVVVGGGVDMTVTVAVPDLVLSPFEVAFTVKVAAFSSAATASMPVSEIVVPGELLSSTDHVTVSLYAPVPVTVAMKLCVLPVSTLTVSGVTATEVMAYTASKAPMSTPAPCGLCVPS